MQQPVDTRQQVGFSAKNNGGTRLTGRCCTKNHAEIEENYPSGRHSMLTLATQIQSMAQ